jgi:hypothetical protein
MENAKKGYFNLAAKWAVIYAITSIVITYIFQFLDIDLTTSPLRFLSYVALIAFLLLTQKEYKDQLGGFLTFGEGFMSGFMYSVIAGVLGAIFAYIYFTFLSPQVWEHVISATKDKMAENKDLSSDQIDAAMNFTAKYGVILGSVGALIVTPIIGAIISLIGAAIFKKDRTIEDIERETPSYPDSTV